MVNQHLDTERAEHDGFEFPTIASRFTEMFLPTAVEFHYNFNLRELANVYQSRLFATKDTCAEYEDLARLYVQEAHRTYNDKLIDEWQMDDVYIVKYMCVCVSVCVWTSLSVYQINYAKATTWTIWIFLP